MHAQDILSVRGFEGGQMPLFRKLPQRGFNRKDFKRPCAVVNLSDLSQIHGDIVSIESLKEAGLIRSNSKAAKLLGNGSIDKAYKVQFSLALSLLVKRSRPPVVRFIEE